MDSSYQVIEEKDSLEIGGKIRILEHKSGARVLSVENKDTNKVFAAAFSTAVDDSTGVAHILEHMVLNGSVKYPTKEPFVDLIKTSLKTFLNAFTFSDKTMYPVASENEKDFYNLVDVYLDAVFHPLLKKEVFLQEGWRYENKDDKWNYAGVVFNEMKGSLASADRVFARLIEEGLFPDTHYKYESGGDPGDIVKLSHEKLVEFHKRHYTPQNAWFFFWGDDSWDRREQALSAYLGDVTKKENFELPSQVKFSSPEIKRGSYPLSSQQDMSARNMVGVYWMADAIESYEQLLEGMVINHILLGNSGSILRKNLIVSGLGSGLVSEGIDSDHNQLVFGVGLKDVREENFSKVENLIIGTLKELVNQGVEQDELEAAINSIEFALRDDDGGSLPKGLEILLRGVHMWLNIKSPMDVLAFNSSWKQVKDKFADKQYVSNWIKKQLLENMHRVRIELIADVKKAREIETTEKKTVEKIVNSWSEEEKQIVLQQNRQLLSWQSRPDSPESLATLPKLTLADVDKQVKKIPTTITNSDGVTQLVHNLLTNGIGYVNLAFDVLGLKSNLMTLLSVWVDLLDELGTKLESYTQFNTRIDKYTGGVEARLVSSANFDGSTKAYFVLRGKALDSQKVELMKVMQTMLFDLDWDNQDRVREVVSESISSIESELLHAGHSIVRGRLAAKLLLEGKLSEMWHGVEQLKFLRGLLVRIENDWQGVLSQLREIGPNIISQNGLLVDFSGDESELESWRNTINKLVQLIPRLSGNRTNQIELLSPTLEALTAETSVNYVGMAGLLPTVNRKGAFSGVVSYLGMSYLWEKVRMTGGAYGAMLSYDPLRGVIYGVSYRDPKLLETWQVYSNIDKYLEQVNLNDQEIEQIAIGLLAEIPQPMANQGYIALMRFIAGWNDERRQEWRNELMSLNMDDFRNAARLFSNLNKVIKSVLCSDRQIKLLKEANLGKLEIIELM